MSVYGKCELKSNQATSDIIENWVASSWSVGFSVGGTNNSEIFVTTAGIYRYDLTMAGTYNGGTNDGIQFRLHSGSNVIAYGASYNGNGNINMGNISGLLQVLDVSKGFKIHGHMNGGGTWDNCSFSLQLIN